AASKDPVGQPAGYSGQSQSSHQETEPAGKRARDKRRTTTYSRHDNKIGCGPWGWQGSRAAGAPMELVTDTGLSGDVLNLGTRIAAAINCCKHVTKVPLQSILEGIHKRFSVPGGDPDSVELGYEEVESRQKPSHLNINFTLNNVEGFSDWAHGSGILVQKGNFNWT
ncbi:hypothetical protein NHX12_011168, partial [Muraenolepis orangiensis]